MRRDDMVREFFLGCIKAHILHHAAEAPVYGLALIAELRRHGYELSPGTLYPVLHQLEEAGCLGRLNRVVNGKVRGHYVLTRRGGVALRDARRTVGELVGELREAAIAKKSRGPAAIDANAPEPAFPWEVRMMAERAGGAKGVPRGARSGHPA